MRWPIDRRVAPHSGATSAWVAVLLGLRSQRQRQSAGFSTTGSRIIFVLLALVDG